MTTVPRFSWALPALLLALAAPCSSFGQTIIEVGTGTLTNLADEAPSPYANTQVGSRNQTLWLASELQAAGMSAGTILSMGFNVSQTSGTTLSGFGGNIGNTTATALTTTWETGLTTAWFATDFTDTEGWTEHTFDFPFSWNGISNLVIETCYFNGTASQNAVVFQTATAFNSFVQRNTFQPDLCTNPGGTHFPFAQRANVRFGWIPLEVPPVAGFIANPLYTCTGTVDFSDTSDYLPTSWAWNFGDDSTSTEQDPTHTYENSGIYTVQLIATNPYGSDTAEVLVTVDLDSPQPIAACEAPSSGTVEDLGILDVNIEGIAHPSGDAATEGYVANTCPSISVVQGTNLDLEVTTANAASHAVRAWLDMDNSGTFTTNELLLSGTGPIIPSSTLIGSGVVLNTPLRLRVIGAYELVTPDPQACGTVQFGQAEDYCIVVIPNALPPVASFEAAPLFSCTGAVQFTDLSLNTPTAWAWDFGDTNTSDAQNPVHTYASSGTYTVVLTAINANGQDDTLAVNLITVDIGAQPVPAVCSPATQAYCCGYGLLGFDLAGINSTSADGSEGYQDRSCGNLATMEEGSSYPWSATHTAATPHDTRIWIDLNNDGDFTSSELVGIALDQASPTASVFIPSGAVLDTPLRLRVHTDVIGQPGGPCDAPSFGQIEDFTAMITPNMDPPTAGFDATPAVTCDGAVQFTDLSTNLPDTWAWNFGDGNTSTEQNPLHTYANTGNYTVSLTASNAFGSDGSVLPGAVLFVPAWQCDTLMLDGDSDLSSVECIGVLSDDGGPTGAYTGGTSGAFTIAPPGAVFVSLDFSLFAWGNNPNRWLAVYDGPDVFSPVIGIYTGNGLGQLPNNGLITSTGPSITLRQEQQGAGGPPPTSAGFLLTWNCSLTGIDEQGRDPIATIRPQPADDHFAVDLLLGTDPKRDLVLRDALGRVLDQRTVTGSETTVQYDVNHLAAGAYVLHVIGASASWSRTLIIR